MIEFSASDTLTKQVYDSADYGQTLMIPLVQDAGLTLQTVTPSTSTFDQSNISATVFPVNDINQIVSNIDEIAIAHEGDDTDFNRIYQWQPEGYGVVYKTNLVACFGLNVEVDTSGSWNLANVQMIITKHKPDGTLVETILDKTVPSSLTALTDVGTQLFIVDIEHSVPFTVKADHPIRIQIIVSPLVGVGTSQVGICPLFCYNSEATNKVFTTSIFKMHIHPSLENAYPVIRKSSRSDELDFSGVTSKGVNR